MSSTLLEYRNFSISIQNKEISASVNLVQDVSFSVQSGKITALIGVSGSGKTLCATAPLKLWPSDFIPTTEGEILFSDHAHTAVNLINAPEKELQKIRGRKIGFVFQEASANLNPTKTIGNHLIETLIFNGNQTKEQARQNAMAQLDSVELNPNQRFMQAFPHQLSGGQKQRVLVALALCLNPAVLIADEPTSSLDAKNQLEITQLLEDIAFKNNLGVLFISHNINLVRRFAKQVVVLDGGMVAESGETDAIFSAPKSRAAKQLIADPITCESPLSNVLHQVRQDENGVEAILEARNISVNFSQSRNSFDETGIEISALKNVSVSLKPAFTTGIVGESGGGKSTLIRCLAGLTEPQHGKVFFQKKALDEFHHDDWKIFRKRVQIVFQDSALSLNPLFSVEDSLLEAIRFHQPDLQKSACKQKLIQLLDRVHLSVDDIKRRPHQLSGGQRQRCCILRALASEPDVLLFDEAVSALDTRTQFQVLNLIAELKKDKPRAIAFVSHDFNVVRYISDEILVIKNGEALNSRSAFDDFLELNKTQMRNV